MVLLYQMLVLAVGCYFFYRCGVDDGREQALREQRRWERDYRG